MNLCGFNWKRQNNLPSELSHRTELAVIDRGGTFSPAPVSKECGRSHALTFFHSACKNSDIATEELRNDSHGSEQFHVLSSMTFFPGGTVLIRTASSIFISRLLRNYELCKFRIKVSATMHSFSMIRFVCTQRRSYGLRRRNSIFAKWKHKINEKSKLQ